MGIKNSDKKSDSDSDSDYKYESQSDSESDSEISKNKKYYNKYYNKKNYINKYNSNSNLKSNNMNNFYKKSSYKNNYKRKYTNPVRENIKRRLSYDRYYLKLSTLNKKKILDIEEEIYYFNKKIVPCRYKILQLKTSISNKSLILKNLETFNNMDNQSSEYNKLSKWINGITMIPFGIYKKLDINTTIQFKVQNYINNAYKKLDDVLYGQYNVKNKIIQVISQWIINPNANTNIIALEGPPGVGKTSLIKNGVSKILNRPFHLVALGGCNDISVLNGHHYTYEGSIWGKLVNILMKSQCMNPIIYFDELDKISNTHKGNDINGLLTHLIDPIQNKCFNDKYFDGIDIDFQKFFLYFHIIILI